MAEGAVSFGDCQRVFLQKDVVRCIRRQLAALEVQSIEFLLAVPECLLCRRKLRQVARMSGAEHHRDAAVHDHAPETQCDRDNPLARFLRGDG